ncbi:hypothetical protein RRF57_010281 [Xylaria bambusicola]|uniref:NOT2/NOT3/NOT5 C-terminal domain-containing protein n=1 Tax=Xylaria bambusicola TaxID=326684 RepID=A0AAN7ZCW9_9PEZI
MPAGFGSQQQPPQQPGRAGSNRLPNGKLANNAGQWAFGGNVPMGGAAASNLQNASRQLGGSLSFAQSLGSQPTSSLDPSEFPSLSNNAQLSSGNPSSLWPGGSRPIGSAIQRNQPTPHSQQTQPEDFFSNPRGNTTQGAFRFGGQASMSQSSQPQPSSIDDFPPLNNSLRNGDGDIGQERGSTLMSTLGFGAQGNSGSGSLQGTRAGNGLLNALSANSRTTDVRSPDGTTGLDLSRSQDLRSSNDDARQKPPGFRDDPLPSQSPKDPAQSSEGRNPLGAIGTNESQSSKNKENDSVQSPIIHDPLAGMAEIDKWGIKGLRTLMNNYPDYAASVAGMDPTSFGLDLTSPAMISTQIWSPFHDTPPRPPIPDFRLPECYAVKNVAPLRNKISNFNEETLMWIFYSCPGDYQQQLAAEQLFQRQWRWHKKLKIWLTKDEIMHPRILSAQHEEGYYIVWNTDEWRKDRRSLTLHYADLETNPSTGL